MSLCLIKNLRRYNSVKNLRFQNVTFSTCQLRCSEVPPQVEAINGQRLQINVNSERQHENVYGQPTFSTHPHLIKPNDLVIGVTVNEFQQRRERLMTAIKKVTRENSSESEQDLNHVFVVCSATKKYMSGKIPYVFRQNSDFFYLTGCLEPDSALVISIKPNDDVVSTLFMRPKDKHAELWDGARTGTENAVDLFGVNEAYPINQFKNFLDSKLAQAKSHLWHDADTSELKIISEHVCKSAGASNSQFHSPAHFVQSLRLFKSPAEMSLMRRTCQIASESFNEVISESRPGDTEHYLYALIDFKCRMRNASYLAYPPVVAAGNNATTIHYINNTQMTRDGDLVLMDAGCEYGGYTSDITRTWPINGSFSEPQKIIYEVVLQLQKELISLIMKTGGETLDKLFDTMCLKLGKYLQEVCLVPKHLTSERDLIQAGFKFCPHHVSHYLGMDVHDTPSMPRSLRILPGMVFTVEPGVYISHDFKEVPAEFRGIGVRIEDDILIDKNNNVEILTAGCVKERSVVETKFHGRRVQV